MNEIMSLCGAYSKYFDKKMSKEEISNTIEKALSLYFKNEV